jgi:hypothetical protein
MKRLLTFLVFMCCAYTAFPQAQFDLSKSKILKTGAQPAAFFLNKAGQMNVICLGLDANYNGVLDAGDTPSSWRLVDPNSSEESAVKVDFGISGIGFPVRPVVDSKNDLLYVASGGKVMIYDMTTFAKKDEITIDPMLSAISLDGNNLYCTVSPWSGNGKVIKYDLSAKKVLMDSIPGYTSPRQTLPYWNGSLAVLSEGGFGATNSKVMLYDVSGAAYKSFAEINVGGVGNHLSISGQHLFVTMNGTNEIKIIDLNTRTLVDSIKLPAACSPREALVIGSDALYKQAEIYVPCYNSKMYYIKNMQVVDSAKCDGALETAAISADGKYLYAADIYLPSSYTANNIINMFSLKGSDVAEAKQYANVYPNPVVDNFTINYYSNNGEEALVTIFDVNGQKVSEVKTNVFDGKLNLSANSLNLNSGKYIVVIASAGKVYNASIVVNK